MRKIRGINKDKIKLNIIDKEKTVGYKNYRYKSHGGIVGLIVFLICLIPELNIDIKAALIMFPVIFQTAKTHRLACGMKAVLIFSWWDLNELMFF